MQMSIGLDRLKRFVCLLLIFVLLFCFFMCPRASAVALEATTVAYAGLLVGTLLVGAGVAFSNPGDMAKTGNAMYRTLQKGNEAIASKIAAISVWAVEHGKSIGSAALRIGKDLYQGIVDTFNASYSDGYFNVAPDGAVHSFEDYDGLYAYLGTLSLGSPVHLYARIHLEDKWVTWHSYWRYYLVGTKLCYDSSEGVLGSEPAVKTHEWEDLGAVPTNVKIRDAGGYGATGHNIEATFEFENQSDKKFIFSFSQEMHNLYPTYRVGSAQSYPVVGDDLAYPSDDYLVKMPDIPSVDSATGEVTYPDNIAYTKDAVAAPYPIGDDGVKVPDIPFDIPVDQTSGKPMDDTGTDTDTPSKPGEGTDTVDWPTSSDLSLPKLIITKFPFCIPFDIANMIGLLEAEPKAPVFKMPLKIGTVVNEEITLDLDQFSDVIRIIRWGELILFVAGLALVTRNYIKW